MDNFSFLDLRVYKEAKTLVILVYRLMDKFPRNENYALCDQLRRAVSSIPSNIAEGSGRVSYKEKIHFLEIAYGSLTETLCQMDVAHDLNYITEEEFIDIKEQTTVIAKQLSGLRKSFTEKLSSANR